METSAIMIMPRQAAHTNSGVPSRSEFRQYERHLYGSSMDSLRFPFPKCCVGQAECDAIYKSIVVANSPKDKDTTSFSFLDQKSLNQSDDLPPAPSNP